MKGSLLPTLLSFSSIPAFQNFIHPSTIHRTIHSSIQLLNKCLLRSYHMPGTAKKIQLWTNIYDPFLHGIYNPRRNTVIHKVKIQVNIIKYRVKTIMKKKGLWKRISRNMTFVLLAMASLREWQSFWGGKDVQVLTGVKEERRRLSTESKESMNWQQQRTGGMAGS